MRLRFVCHQYSLTPGYTPPPGAIIVSGPSLLASLPPRVRWQYDYTPERGTEEARLLAEFLKPRDWISDD